MADSGRPRPADPDAAESRTASPLAGKKRAQQSPGLRSKYQSSAPGHCFKKVTLTKPTYCHSCSDFIWGIIGFLCEGKTANMLCLVIGVITYARDQSSARELRKRTSGSPRGNRTRPELRCV